MALKNFRTAGFITNTNVVPSTTPTQVGLFDARQVTATLTKETESRDVKGIVDGSDQAQVLDTIITSTTYTFSVDIEAIDSDTLALMFGEMWASADWTDRMIKRVVVPTGSPYEIVDADILSTLTAADIQVAVVDNGAWGFKRPLEIITGAGTPTGDQAKLDATNTKLILPATFAGAPLKISPKKARTGIDTLGVVASPKLLEDLKYVGHVASTRKEEILVDVDLAPSGGWELPIGDETSLTLEFKAIAKGANRSAVRLGRIAA